MNGGMAAPFPEGALERPAGFTTWTPQILHTPQGVIAQLRRNGQHIELWRLDAEAERPEVGACLDRNDADELVASGSASVKGVVTDLFGEGARPIALDRIQGRTKLIDSTSATYSYTFLSHQRVPCEAFPGPRRAVTRNVLRPRR